MKRILGTVVLACVLAGCTSAPSGEQAESEPSGTSEDPAPAAYSMDETAQPAWRTKLDVVGQPVVVDDVAVVLTQPKGDLHLVALDLTTGRELWRKPYDPIAFPMGSTLAPVVTKDAKGRDLVVLRQPAVDVEERGFYYAPLQAVLPRSGKVVGETGRGGVYYACPDGRNVCLDGLYNYSGSPLDPGGIGPVTGGAPPSRWDPLHPRRESRRLGGPDATFRLGLTDLYATRMGPQRIVRLEKSKQLWSRTMTAAFGPRSSTGKGWSVDYVKEADVFTGAVGHTFASAVYDRYNRGRAVTYEHDEIYQVVGLDGATGERLWRIAGANPFCGLAALAEAAQAPPIACVVDGRTTEQQDHDIQRRGLSAQLMSYDPTTGEPTWSIEFDRRTAKDSVLDNLVVRAPSGAIVGTSEGLQAVDLADGSTAPAPDDLVTLCSDSVEKVGESERNGGTLFFACTPNGEPTKDAVTEWGVASLPETAGWRLVSVKGRVLGYQLD